MTPRAARALLVAGALSTVAGCVDTTLPGGTSALVPRTCSSAELEGFRAASTATTRDDLWVAFIDVGQGDAIWIRTPGDMDSSAREILVDSGDAGAYGRSLGGAAVVKFMTDMEWVPGSPIHYLIVTNPDSDHYSGAREVMSKYHVGAYSDTGLVAVESDADGTTGYGTFIHAIEAAGIPMLRPASKTLPATFDDWSNGLVEVKLLSADENAVAEGRETAENRGSIVMRLDFGGTRLLLTGDATKGILDGLAVHHAGELQANVLKVAHHGSKAETTDTFLDAVFPAANASPDRYGVITVGAGNTYGHPGDALVSDLQTRVGLRGLFRTDRGDAGKHLDTTMGDDHVIMHVTSDGQLTVCYAYPDTPAPASAATALTPSDLN